MSFWKFAIGAAVFGGAVYLVAKDDTPAETKNLMTEIQKLPPELQAPLITLLGKPGVSAKELETAATSLDKNGFKDAAAALRKYAEQKTLSSGGPGATPDLTMDKALINEMLA